MTDKLFAQRVNGQVVGLYANRQDFTDQQPIDADSADALAFFNPPAPVPVAVDMAQARLALLAVGLLSTVDAAIADMSGPEGEAARIEWEYRATVRRDSPLVVSLAAALGLDDSTLDALFVEAAAL